MKEGTIRVVTASEEDAEYEDGYFQLGLADQPEGDGDVAIVLTRSFEFDEQDRAQGMDTYCLIMPDQMTRYGGIASWGLNDRVLVLRLDEEASKFFDADGGYRLNLQLDHASLRKLEEGLARVLVNVPRSDGTIDTAAQD